MTEQNEARPVTLSLLRRIAREFEEANLRFINIKVTIPCDAEADVRSLPNFVSAIEYNTGYQLAMRLNLPDAQVVKKSTYEDEIGVCERYIFVLSRDTKGCLVAEIPGHSKSVPISMTELS